MPTDQNIASFLLHHRNLPLPKGMYHWRLWSVTVKFGHACRQQALCFVYLSCMCSLLMKGSVSNPHMLNCFVRLVILFGTAIVLSAPAALPGRALLSKSMR
jgi:hypothetical protein